MKERWDYEQFVLEYNDLAIEYFGWKYPDEINRDDLRAWYESGIDKTIKEFARARYMLDQQV